MVSEYYGRGLFNKVTVVTENETVEPPAPAGPAQPTPPAPTPAPAAQPYGPGAEAKLRLQEGQSKQSKFDYWIYCNLLWSLRKKSTSYEYQSAQITEHK